MGKIIINYNYYYYYKKVKGYSQKYGNKKGVTSGSMWDGEEGGDEDVGQEELVKKITNNQY